MPITEHVTKFGGRPVWYTQPQWPLGRASGEPMQFICQIALDEQIFGDTVGRMAYLFMTEQTVEREGSFDTYDPDGGENAVIVQPGVCDVPVAPLTDGPRLYDQSRPVFFLGPLLKAVGAGDACDIAKPCEFAVDVELGEDPDFIVENGMPKYDGVPWSKIGGNPRFLQHPQIPEGGPWKLLLQLAEEECPFDISFADGKAYAFINEQGTYGKLLFQAG